MKVFGTYSFIINVLSQQQRHSNYIPNLLRLATTWPLVWKCGRSVRIVFLYVGVRGNFVAARLMKVPFMMLIYLKPFENCYKALHLRCIQGSWLHLGLQYLSISVIIVAYTNLEKDHHWHAISKDSTDYSRNAISKNFPNKKPT